MQKKRRELPPLSFFIESNFLLADADETHDHGAQHHVEQQLEDKVRADKANDHILADVCTKAHRIRPAADGLHKEEQAADQEHAGIDHRADHSLSLIHISEPTRH